MNIDVLKDTIESANEIIIDLQRRIDKAKSFISFICFNGERPLTINECAKLYFILNGSDVVD